MITDTALLRALRVETLSPLATELLERFAADVAARDAAMAACLNHPQPLSIELSPPALA